MVFLFRNPKEHTLCFNNANLYVMITLCYNDIDVGIETMETNVDQIHFEVRMPGSDSFTIFLGASQLIEDPCLSKFACKKLSR